MKSSGFVVNNGSPSAIAVAAIIKSASRRGPGGLDQDRVQVGVAVPGRAGAPPAGRFVVGRADPGPGGQVHGVREEPGMSVPISEMMAAAASGPIPGMVVSRSRSARKGVIIASTC